MASASRYTTAAVSLVSVPSVTSGPYVDTLCLDDGQAKIDDRLLDVLLDGYPLGDVEDAGDGPADRILDSGSGPGGRGQGI